MEIDLPSTAAEAEMRSGIKWETGANKTRVDMKGKGWFCAAGDSDLTQLFLYLQVRHTANVGIRTPLTHKRRFQAKSNPAQRAPKRCVQNYAVLIKQVPESRAGKTTVWPPPPHTHQKKPGF